MTPSDERSPRREQPALRLPDFFIVGHAKSGTTALYEMLRRHPQLFMPELKEPWFFASDMRPRFQGPRAGAPPETLEQYAALFSDATPDQRVGEGTSAYLWSRTAAQAIAEAQPQARIITILREPASFLHSYHLQLLQSHIETERDLRRAIALESERREGRRVPRDADRPQLLQYSDHVRYVEQLRRYREAFGAERMLVLIYDDYRNDNLATVRAILRFLEVDDAWPIDLLEANPSLRLRSRRLDDLVHALSVGRGPFSGPAREVLKSLAPRALRRQGLELTRRKLIYARAPAPDEVLMRDLRRRFTGEVQALSEYLDRDLIALWGYDHVGR